MRARLLDAHLGRGATRVSWNAVILQQKVSSRLLHQRASDFSKLQTTGKLCICDCVITTGSDVGKVCSCALKKSAVCMGWNVAISAQQVSS